jgi:hypothetical protein
MARKYGKSNWSGENPTPTKNERRKKNEPRSAEREFVLLTPLSALLSLRQWRSGEDRTPFEIFIAGVRGWEADLWRWPGGKFNHE